MPQDNKLDSPIQYLKGVGPKRSKILKNFGIETIEELFYYFPRRYEDRTNFVSISQLKENEYQTIKGEVFIKGERRSWRRRGFSIFQLMIRDKSGKITAVWFNQPYLKKLFKNGQSVILYGRVEEYEGALQMNSPEFEVLDEKDKEAESLSLGRMVPIYPLSEGITQRYFRKLIKQTLDKFISKIDEPLPYDIRKRKDLL
ncbi:MAG: OB-fold nucleic acid binding domain-containing protein, partial [Candidatus Omnitrophica bacterium]|nr:OB-fold nucleic acid binding domain-containing protein [Candidatus Omnitrophota bacterium]